MRFMAAADQGDHNQAKKNMAARRKNAAGTAPCAKKCNGIFEKKSTIASKKNAPLPETLFFRQEHE